MFNTAATRQNIDLGNWTICGMKLMIPQRVKDAITNCRGKHFFTPLYFMNPCEKYHARRRKPFKLALNTSCCFFFVFLESVLYGHLHNITVGNHEYERNGVVYTPLSLCQEFYRNGSIYSGNETFEIDTQSCFHILNCISKGLMISVKIMFVLKAINLETVRHRELPYCYDFTVTITFNNQVHSAAQNTYLTVLFDCLIIVTCLASFVLCTRSVISGIQLQFEYTLYYRNHCGKHVPWSDKLEFVSGWYILIIVSDILTIIGSILKIEIHSKVLRSYDVCSILLGTGTMLVWIGVIRYLGYFRKYNILILTLRAARPNVIRFICCAGIIYLSYCFCGWIVLGPYHEKFRTLNTVSECLFSLINGDDMFSTFENMKKKSYLVWLFSRVYLYTFVSLFIYMILNLFITLITDTYDTIKVNFMVLLLTFIFSKLQTFLSLCNDLPQSGVYRDDRDCNSCILNCCIR
uniref:Uncharacterized protein n=1 Tax=Monopterus albus TaxID=43700 RepID=A0A3Q3JTR6_MONAL